MKSEQVNELTTVVPGNQRKMLSLDFPDAWRDAARKYVLPYFPDEGSLTALTRTMLNYKELISCFMTENEMREAKLLPSYRPQGGPEILLFALFMAAKRRAGTEDMTNLQTVFQREWKKLQAHYHARGEKLPGE